MQRITGTNTIDLGGGKLGFKDRNTTAGIAGTVLISPWGNNVQEELCNIVETAGGTLDGTNFGQVLAALLIFMQRGAGNWAVDSGTANAMVVTLSPVPTSLASLTGATLRVQKIASANTGAVTLAVNGFAATAVVRESGVPLQAGDLVASATFTVVYNGTNFVLSSQRAGLASQSAVLAQNASYHDMSGSRAIGTTYTNSTGKDMAVAVNCSSSSGFNPNFWVNGVDVGAGQTVAAGVASTVYFIVPAGQTYKVTVSAGAGYITSGSWMEVY